jgi:outer membrane protein assembly factor BamB
MSLSRSAIGLLSGSAALLTACAADGSVDQGMRSGETGGRESMTATIDSMVATGRFKGERWRMNLAERWGGPVRARSVAVDGDLLLIQDTENRIHAIDAKDGIHRWPLEVPGPLTQTIGGTPTTVTFVATDEIVAVDRRTGVRANGTSALPRPYGHLGFFPSGRAVTIGTTAYVGRLAPFGLQALDLRGASDGWSYATRSAVVDVVAYGDGATAQVLGVTEDGLLFSLPPRGAGESTWAPSENWYKRLPGTHVVTPLAISGDSLVFGSANGFLYHVDVRGGTVRWKVGCGSNLRGHEATIAGGAVYQVADDELHAIDLESGSEAWVLKGARRAITRIGDRVYADLGSEVAVVDARSGKELARFPMQGLSMPTVQGGGSLLASDGTNVFALE